MQIVSKLLFLCMTFLLLSACLQNEESNQLINDTEYSTPVEYSIEEAEALVSFEIKQPSIPFQVTNEVAKISENNPNINFDAVEITYENEDEGLILLYLITNSKLDGTPNGNKGLTLANGSQTWEQGTEHASAIHWNHEGLTYTLVSTRNSNDNFEPLYDYQTLIEIANTIK